MKKKKTNPNYTDLRIQKWVALLQNQDLVQV